MSFTPHEPRWFSPETALAAVAQSSARLGVLDGMLRGVLMRVFMSENAELRRYRPTEHDVFAATLFKSGTNWSMQICVQVAHRGEAEFAHIHDLVAWPEAPFKQIVALSDPRPRQRSPTGLRVIKSHLMAGQVPYDPSARYVTIIRDPKEVLVSAYYFMLGQLGVLDRMTPAEFFEVSLHDDLLPRVWAEHTAGFWLWRDKPNVCLRIFDEVVADLPAAVDDIAALMGVALTASERDRVIEKSSFAWMKKHDAAFAPPRSPLVPESQHPSMMRKGKAGSSKELVGPSLAARIDAASEQALLRFGSDFPYREHFVRTV